VEKIWQKSYPKIVPTEIDISRYQNLLDIFTASVTKFGNKKVFTNFGKSLTYKQLDELSTSFASYLQNDLGLKKGDRLAIQMPNVLQYPIAIFGALKAGLIIVNTNPLYTDREMKHQFTDSGVKAILIMANFADKLEKIRKETPIEHIIITEIGDMLGLKGKLMNVVIKRVKKMVPAYSLPDAVPFQKALALGRTKKFTPVSTSLEDVAFLQYTGGTTGVSKGAMLTHKNMVANMQQVCQWLKPILIEGAEVAIAPLPMYHIFCLTVHAFCLVQIGGNNILVTNPKDLPAFIKLLKTTPVTLLTGINTLYNALLNHADFKEVRLPTLKLSVAGGMALQRAVAEKWQAAVGTPIIEGYGLTEASPVICINLVDGKGKLGHIGLPIPSTDVSLLDDDENEVPLGEPGELCARGPQVMKGYWQRPDETAKVMTKNGWLKTGDVAVVDEDGFFKIVDRKKDMILVSGFNVYPNEVEDVIATHPGVLELAAVGVPDPHSGEAVKVFVVKKDPSLTAQSVIDHARKGLVAYKVPKHVEFRNELPKTNVGKILRRMLKEELVAKA
jgi:long-chain acyl-CoA synthetase